MRLSAEGIGLEHLPLPGMLRRPVVFLLRRARPIPDRIRSGVRKCLGTGDLLLGFLRWGGVAGLRGRLRGVRRNGQVRVPVRFLVATVGDAGLRGLVESLFAAAVHDAAPPLAVLW